jgi:transcriptional regulator with XRE-family HTH domain
MVTNIAARRTPTYNACMLVRHFATFSSLIKAIRRENQLSQRALAKSLSVSPGYIGQWELQISQPSSEITLEICRLFAIHDIDYVQRLAYAGRAPDWLKDSILGGAPKNRARATLSPDEAFAIRLLRALPEHKQKHLLAKLEGWVEASLESDI